MFYCGKMKDNRRVIKKILKSKDCMTCRLCCKFGKDDKFDAPMFSSEEKQLIENMELNKKLSFKPFASLWKIVLDPLADEKGRYICPLYDSCTHRCLIYKLRSFDCYTWPFYIMKKENKIYITVSLDCPTIQKKSSEELIQFSRFKLVEFMIKKAKQNSDLITEFHGNTKILFEIPDFILPTKSTNI